jgi:peptide-methionine (S)-S-oxide reductase
MLISLSSKNIFSVLFVALSCLGLDAPITWAQNEKETRVDESSAESTPTGSPIQIATFGGGCFWCVEAVFENMKGVKQVVSGYAGGRNANPTYQQVCTGRTGHAEVCQIYYDPSEVTFDELLEVFWKTHDPTTLNRQGPDVGTQYRSVIFYHDEGQRELAEKYKKKLDELEVFASKIVTEISPLPTFYEAEEYHQDYYQRNPNQGYCAAVVRPKVEKFKQAFADKVKGN